MSDTGDNATKPSPSATEPGENAISVELTDGGGRRLGSRSATRFSVMVKHGQQRFRARAAQLSTTGVVLDLRFVEGVDLDRLLQLELVVPGFPRPIPVVARPVRTVGRLRAYEFLSIQAVDQLTLAEHLDRIHRPGWA